MTTAAVLPVPASASDADDPGDHDAAPFREHTAVYRVTRNGDELGLLNAELSQRDDGLWYYRVESEATAFVVRMLGVSSVEAGWFAWDNGRVVPLTYHHVARRPGKDRYWQHSYDWPELHTDTVTHTGETSVPLTVGAVDPLTLRLAVAAALPEAAEQATDLEFAVVERDELETQQVRFRRRETVGIDGRCFDTAVFERFRAPGSSRNYIAWHAGQLGWIPVRTLHHEDDDRLVIELIDYASTDRSDTESSNPSADPGPAGSNPTYRLPPSGGDCAPVDNSDALP